MSNETLFPKARRIAVIAAHPDDEVLGCGGTIARHARDGAEVHVMIMAEGATARSEQRTPSAHASYLHTLAHSAEVAHQILGTRNLQLKDFPDNRLDSVDFLDIVKSVEQFVEITEPEIVYTHFPHDLNIDHRLVSEAVQTACRPIPGRNIQQILFFEVPSSTEWRMSPSSPAFHPNYFVDITETLDAKCKALQAYHQEMRAWPHARSITATEHLARWRGASVGREAAEAFILGRQIA